MTRPAGVFIETQAELTRDAVRREYRPGAVVVRVDGATLQLTSWPWFDGEGEERSARVMARTVVGDCRTNHETSYFAIMRKLRDEPLE